MKGSLGVSHGVRQTAHLLGDLEQSLRIRRPRRSEEADERVGESVVVAERTGDLYRLPAEGRPRLTALISPLQAFVEPPGPVFKDPNRIARHFKHEDAIFKNQAAILSPGTATTTEVRVSPDVGVFSPGVPETLAIAAPTAVQAQQFDWDDALIGGTIGLVAAMIGAAGVALVMRRRGSLRAA